MVLLGGSHSGSKAARQGLDLYLPAICVSLFALLQMWPLWGGSPPICHDHTAHLYKAWQFWEKLTQGQFGGWSSAWFFGYPIEELYPPGTDLWVCLFRILTLGLLSWNATYALAFVAFWIFAALSVLKLGTRLFGAPVGVVSSLLFLLDPGGFREGGWSYTVVWGVWGQALALAFFYRGWAHLLEGWEDGTLRPRVWAGLNFGLALVCHPVILVFLAVSLPLALVSRWVMAHTSPLREGVGAGGVLMIAGGVTCFWLLPTLVRSEYSLDIGNLWVPLSALVGWLPEGRVFSNNPPLWLHLAYVGGGLALWKRDWRGTWLVGMAVVCLFLATHEGRDLLMKVSNSFSKIQYLRLTHVAKVAVYLLAANVLVKVGQWLRLWAEGELSGLVSGWVKKVQALGGVLLLLSALSLGIGLVLEAVDRSEVLETTERSLWWEDVNHLADWLKVERARDPAFSRVASALPDRDDHRLLILPALTGIPLLKVGYTPVKLYRYAPHQDHPGLYLSANVRWEIRTDPPRYPDRKKVADFGEFSVYELVRFNSQRVRLLGDGQVKRAEFSDESIELTLAGTSSTSRIQLAVGPYPRWEVKGPDGQILESGTWSPPGGDVPLTWIDLPAREGTTVLSYVLRPLDVCARLISVITLTICAFLLRRTSSLSRDVPHPL